MRTKESTQTIISESLNNAKQHYENFPVASIFLPKNLRAPVGLIYHFARQADDFADEGDLTIAQRLVALNTFRDELELLQAYIKPKTAFFKTLGEMIDATNCSYSNFFNLLDAFSQDVTQTRYANYAQVLDYCARSANPIGRLMLQLYKQSSAQNIQYSDKICTALQIINFLQDIAIDFNKNDGKQRIYMCQDELADFGISEQTISNFVTKSKTINADWQRFMQFNLTRVSALLNTGKPLGRVLKGRIGFEMRMIIAGGEQIIHKINKVNGDIFKHRPTLNFIDWLIIFTKALFKR
ncbi:MAG: squalene synthase HpnC [Methylophilaceae bacterium]